jgi:hypothetical protein
MQPAKLNLTIYKGSTFSKEFQWKTGDPAQPVDITDCSLRMQIRKTIDDTTFVDELTTQNGKITILNAAEGRFRIDIAASVSTDYKIEEGVYDLEIVYPNSTTVYRLLEGDVAAIPEVTR